MLGCALALLMRAALAERLRMQGVGEESSSQLALEGDMTLDRRPSIVHAGLATPIGRQVPKAWTSSTADDVLRRWLAYFTPDIVRQVLDAAPFRYQVATCTGSGAVTLWGREGLHLKLLRQTVGEVGGILFFPLGDRMLTWSRNGMATIWSTSSGRALVELPHRRPVTCARIFASGDRVATCTQEGSGHIWDARSAVAWHSSHRSSPNDMMCQRVWAADFGRPHI